MPSDDSLITESQSFMSISGSIKFHFKKKKLLEVTEIQEGLA